MDRITFDDRNPSAPARIRDLAITVVEVFRALRAGSPKEVLQQYPELELEDLVAVEAYVAESIRTRDHDDYTGRPLLPRRQLRHGRYYKGRCRNATIARWHGEEGRFYHWRVKFDRVYLQTIRYPTDQEEPWWDIFFVVEELPGCKFEIPFDLEAALSGHQEDLFEYNQEMWTVLPKPWQSDRAEA